MEFYSADIEMLMSGWNTMHLNIAIAEFIRPPDDIRLGGTRVDEPVPRLERFSVMDGLPIRLTCACLSCLFEWPQKAAFTT
jgi:hypothetical protein